MSFLRRVSNEARWVIAGLGNPGERYERTRHNAGAMAAEVLARRVGGSFKRHKSGCLVVEGTLAGERIVVTRTASYMNESGAPLRALTGFYKSPLERLIVVHDELDVPFGEVRIKIGGGTAGHNGLKSLVQHLGGKDFVRVRVGISRPRSTRDSVDYVLSNFSAAERKELLPLLEEAADAVERILEAGSERAMNEINTRAE